MNTIFVVREYHYYVSEDREWYTNVEAFASMQQAIKFIEENSLLNLVDKLFQIKHKSLKIKPYMKYYDPLPLREAKKVIGELIHDLDTISYVEFWDKVFLLDKEIIRKVVDCLENPYDIEEIDFDQTN